MAQLSRLSVDTKHVTKAMFAEGKVKEDTWYLQQDLNDSPDQVKLTGSAAEAPELMRECLLGLDTLQQKCPCS